MVRFTFKSFIVNNLEQELGEDHGKIQTKAGRTGSTAVSVYELTSLSLRKVLHRLGAIQLVLGISLPLQGHQCKRHIHLSLSSSLTASHPSFLRCLSDSIVVLGSPS